MRPTRRRNEKCWFARKLTFVEATLITPEVSEKPEQYAIPNSTGYYHRAAASAGEFSRHPAAAVGAEYTRQWLARVE